MVFFIETKQELTTMRTIDQIGMSLEPVYLTVKEAEKRSIGKQAAVRLVEIARLENYLKAIIEFTRASSDPKMDYVCDMAINALNGKE